jgi:hypothetical protein
MAYRMVESPRVSALDLSPLRPHLPATQSAALLRRGQMQGHAGRQARTPRESLPGDGKNLEGSGRRGDRGQAPLCAVPHDMRFFAQDAENSEAPEFGGRVERITFPNARSWLAQIGAVSVCAAARCAENLFAKFGPLGLGRTKNLTPIRHQE